jgi:hypothetical protein
MGKGADFLLLHISAGLWKSKQAKKNQKDDGRGFRVEKPKGGGWGRVRKAKEYAGELLFRPLRLRSPETPHLRSSESSSHAYSKGGRRCDSTLQPGSIQDSPAPGRGKECICVLSRRYVTCAGPATIAACSILGNRKQPPTGSFTSREPSSRYSLSGGCFGCTYCKCTEKAPSASESLTSENCPFQKTGKALLSYTVVRHEGDRRLVWIEAIASVHANVQPHSLPRFRIYPKQSG